MPIVSALGAMSSRGFGEFAQSSATGKYIEDYFSTYLYTGDGSSSRVINTGIALADTAAWSNITSTLDAGYRNTFFINANGIYYAGANGANTSSVIGVNTTTGATLFNRNLSGTGGNDFYNGISGDSAGNIICVGRIATGLNASIVKYNSSGSIQWQRQISGGGNTAAATCVACDSSNNIYVGGFYTTSYARGLVAKYNSSGVLQWQVLVYDTGSSNGTNLTDITVGASGDVYICGNSYDAGAYPYAFVAKINTSGVFQWSRSLKVNFDSFDSISIDSSDNVYVCGRFNQAVTQYGVVAKYNSSGTLQWQIRPSTNVTAYDCAADSSGNVYVNIANLNLTKISTSGSLTWTATIKPTSSFFYGVQVYGTNIYASCPTAQGTAILATDGTTTSGQAGNIAVYPASNTITTASATSATATVAITTSSLTESALSRTDSAGSLTSSIYTQAAVTGAGGLIWVKGRDNSSNSTGHILTDTARGRGSYLQSQNTNAAVNSTSIYDLTAFLVNGFAIGQANNFNFNSSVNYASWTWRKTPKFFDVVTYTGDGTTNQSVSHNLSSTPRFIIIKKTSASGDNWKTFAWDGTGYTLVYLNRTNAGSTASGLSTYLSTTAVNVGGISTNVEAGCNDNGSTYVMYLFASDAGGFGLDETQNVISCGSVTIGGGGTATVNLGWEPQFVLTKLSNGADGWNIVDSMRGNATLNGTANTEALLRPNTSAIETQTYGYANPTSTGFQLSGWASGNTFIYMAIRRGPMKVPTDATTVFNPIAYTTANASSQVLPVGFPADTILGRDRTTTVYFASSNWPMASRLTGNGFLRTTQTAAEVTFIDGVNGWDDQNSIDLAGSFVGNGNFLAILYAHRRAPSFFDVVCYTGTGASLAVNHNLQAVPQLIIIKRRDAVSNWPVWRTGTGTGTTFGYFNDPSAEADQGVQILTAVPTSSIFNVAAWGPINASGGTYIAYLFATCPGVSSVGTYTGTGATQTISCGFTGGARYVLIKRTDSAGSWWVWDTARGMIAGTDPRLAYNSSNAEINANWVYTTTGGFQIVTSDATVNASGGTYIYLAIA